MVTVTTAVVSERLALDDVRVVLDIACPLGSIPLAACLLTWLALLSVDWRAGRGRSDQNDG
jgi:hypothetical protein